MCRGCGKVVKTRLQVVRPIQKVTSSWFFLSTLTYDARSTTHQNSNFSFHLTKCQSVNEVYWNNRRLFWDLCEAFKYSLWAKKGAVFFMMTLVNTQIFQTGIDLFLNCFILQRVHSTTIATYTTCYISDVSVAIDTPQAANIYLPITITKFK